MPMPEEKGALTLTAVSDLVGGAATYVTYGPLETLVRSADDSEPDRVGEAAAR
jgi:hypothetical protein